MLYFLRVIFKCVVADYDAIYLWVILDCVVADLNATPVVRGKPAGQC